jgi:large repetitive protein
MKFNPVVRIVLVGLFGFLLSAAPTPAQAADLTDYGLNYKNAYFNVSGGLAPSGGNFQVDTWFRINEWNGTTGEHAVIIGNNGSGMILKVTGTNQIYVGQAWTSSASFTCSTTWALETWYQLTAVQDASGQLAWINGASCGTKQNRASYSGANQLGGQSSPERLTQNADISSFRFMNTPVISTNSSTISVPAYPLTQVTNTTFLFNPQSVSSSMTDTTGKTLTKAGGGTITRSQVFLIQQNLTLASTKSSMRYNETATLTTSGTSGTGAITYTVNSGCSVTGNILKATGASGNCTVSATIAADATYAAKTSSTLTIPLSKGDQQSTMTADQVTSSATWTGSAYTATPTYSTSGSPGTGAVTFTVANGTATGCTLSNNTATAVLTASTSGTCVTTASKAASTNYDSASVQLTFTFLKASSTTSLAISRSSATYGATVYETATVTPSSATGTISFSNNGTPITGCSSVSITSGVAVCASWKPSVGIYSPIVATYSGNAYYLTSTSNDVVALEITKTPLIVTPDSKTVNFGASAPTYSFTYQGFMNSENVSSSSFTTGLTPPVCTNANYTTSTSADASPLTISCTGGLATNYSFDTSATANLTISKATTSLSLALANATPTYGAVDTITATASVPGTVTFKSGGINVSGCENVATTGSSPITAQCIWIPGGVASYTLTAVLTPTNSTDFADVTASALTPTSVRAAITVTPDAGQSKVFGANSPTLTYSITSGALVGSDVLSGALTYTGSNVGNYAITIGTLANANYIITLTTVNFAIIQASQSAVSLSSLSAAFSPSNKTVSLTGTGGTGTGGYQYALDTSNTTAGCSVTGSTLTYTTAGTCVIAVKRVSDTNYLERIDAVSFSIGLATQTITFGSLSAKSYSSDTFTVSATSSASLTVVFTSASQSVCTTSGVSGSTITLLSVGTCVINANQIGDSNISAASQVSQNFTVNPRAITVTADAKTKVYGATDPALTYTITTGSLVLGDAITGALTRAAGTDVGTYQIQQGALTTTNNPKYAITFVSANLTITRATPALVLTYPNSNVAILRPGAVDTPTVTTSSSSGALTFATTAASSICTVETTTGVISLFGAGSCPVAMSTALTTNYIALTETTTVTVALLSTSLVGIDPSDLVSMGQPFFSHASIDQSYSFSSGNNGASVAIPAGTLDPSVPISISLLTDSADQRAMIGGTGTSVLSVVVSWVASDGSVPNTNTGKAISVTLTNPAIKSGAKVYSIIGNQSTLLGTATADGSVTTLITEDPVLLVINPVAVAPQLVTAAPQSVSAPAAAVVVDNSAAIAAANARLAAERAAAELKAAAEKFLAEQAEAAAIKAAAELADVKAKADAEFKAAQEKAAAELRIAEELRLAQLKAEEELKLAAQKKAAEDAALAAKAAKPAVTLYSVSSSLKLNAYNTAYLQKYVKSLKNGASVTCIGYSYSKNTTVKKATALAKSQATAVCALMKKTNKTLKTSVVVYPASKAPKAATGAKWVGVSYRIDGFKK